MEEEGRRSAHSEGFYTHFEGETQSVSPSLMSVMVNE